MTVLGNLARRSLENPANPLSSVALLGGGQAAGVSVTEQRAYGLTAYYRAVALTASTMAGLPLKVFRNDTRERVTRRTVLDTPNLAQTPFEFWQSMFANALGWGNAYAMKTLNRAGIVESLTVIHPSRVTVDRVPVSDRAPDGKRFVVLDEDSGQRRAYSSRDIFHLPYLSPTGIEGIRPLQLARESLGIGIASERTSANFYAKGSKLAGILKTEQVLEEGVADRLKRQWNQKHAGVDASGDIAVLDAGATFTPVGIPPADAELLGSRKFTVSEIARIVGCPPHLVADVEKSTSWGTGIEQQFITWVQVTLLGWLTLTSQRITRELLPGGWTAGQWYAEHSVEGLLRGDSKTRAAFYHQAVIDGWMSRNEIRVRENLEPQDGLDEFLVPSNLTLINVDGEFVPLSANGMEGATDDADDDSE